MNISFIIFTRCYPNWESFVNDIASGGSDVAIVLIICLTVLISLLAICFMTFGYLSEKKATKEYQKTIETLKQRIADLEEERDKILEDKNNAEKKLQITPEQKENNRFLDFCYDMAKSTEMDDLDMKRECWDILKERLNISPKTKKENEN